MAGLVAWILYGQGILDGNSGAPPAATVGGDRYGAPTQIGAISSREIDECSGIVTSRRFDGRFWVHNDSGADARLFGLRRDGTVEIILKLENVKGEDWEDIATGPPPGGAREGAPPYLYIADTGNNRRLRAELAIHRLVEPDLEPVATRQTASMARTETLRFQYESGRHDCEALAVHPTTGDIYLFTKTPLRTGIFRLQNLEDTSSVQTAELVSSLHVGDLVTGADWSRDGSTVALRTYLYVYEYGVSKSEPFGKDTPVKKLFELRFREAQGEAICYTSDGSILTTSEGALAPIHQLRRLPAQESPPNSDNEPR